jgi:uncharacterized membrane protein YccC
LYYFSLFPQPSAFFTYAASRFTEVMVGILCASIVSDLIFPQHLGTMIIRVIHARYTEFVSFVQALFSGNVELGSLERKHLRFIDSVLSLESLRGAAVLEATHTRRENARLRRLNRDFMAASTTLHSLHQLLERLRKDDSPAASALISLSDSLVQSLLKDGELPRNAEDAGQVARQIAAFRMDLQRLVEARQRELGLSRESLAALDFETGVELIKRFVLELHEYTRAYILSPNELSAEADNELRFASRTDFITAIMGGVRAILAVWLVSTFWIWTAWSYGSSALMMVAIVCALFAPAADPVRAIKGGFLGISIAFPISFAFKFFIMPFLAGFGMLCAAMVPLLMFGAWLYRSPKTAMIGLGYSCMVCFMTAPSNAMQYDPVHILNYGMALMIGMAGAIVMFATFVPVTGSWLRRRIPRTMRHQVLIACFAPLPGLIHRFESSTRDVLRAIAAVQNAQDAHDRHTIDWMFLVLELGRAIIDLREGIQSFPQKEAAGSIKKCIRLVADLSREPTAQHRAVAIAAVDEAIHTINNLDIETSDKFPQNAMRLIKTSLHCIRITLLDDETACIVENSTVNLGGALNAA